MVAPSTSTLIALRCVTQTRFSVPRELELTIHITHSIAINRLDLHHRSVQDERRVNEFPLTSEAWMLRCGSEGSSKTFTPCTFRPDLRQT